MKRHFLLLQGVSSPFFKQLGQALSAQGHRVTKVSFNGGDVVYWMPHGTKLFRRDLTELPVYLRQLYKSERITDQVLFGDRRPVHQIALEQARLLCIRNHVFEEGYFRPCWVTLEREGVNSRSLFPRDPDRIRAAGLKLLTSANVNNTVKHFESPFWKRAAHDVTYHLASSLNPLVFPKYQTHANVWAPIEYAGFVKRKIKNKRGSEQERIKFNSLFQKSANFYFLPLQLNSDSQVQDQPVFNSMPALLEYVIASFANYAPISTQLVVKNHPLDFGQIDYQTLCDKLATQYGVSGRIIYLEMGDLNKITKKALGTITLNSTVGSVALEQGSPTLCLAEALYNFSGLTARCSLDDFWVQLPKPDPTLFSLFKAVVMHTTQVNGGFYSSQGINLAVAASVNKLTADKSPLEQLMQQIPL